MNMVKPRSVTPLAGPVGEGLVVNNIGKSFRGRPVVKGVSLHLARGEVAGLLGPNGAGKTTCFYMITGLIPADYGAIYLDGEDITDQPMYQRARMGVGYLPQETSIFRGMTVEQNVMSVVELRERDKKKAKATVTQLLEELHIEHLRGSPAISLSGGERRRVEIARALASKPSFMLLDEPFAGIDPLAIADIREVISYLKARGIGILITDHNVRETLDIIDRASIIHAGEVLFEGSPDEIIDNPDVRRVYLGDSFA
jgi:lipopolysaccharide export system ATP-binding protein